MPVKKTLPTSRTETKNVPFSLVPALSQQQMYKAVSALTLRKPASASGAEVAEIAVSLALDEQDLVILACPAEGARMVRKAGSVARSGSSGGKLAAATVKAVEKLLKNPKATALVCAGKLEAGPTTLEDHHRAFSFAACHKLPILYLVSNSYTPGRRQQFDLRTLYAEFGIPVFSVDANDAIAAYRVATEALHNARHNRGPCVIEALVMSGGRGTSHPLTLLRDYMERHGSWPG
jgi:hypothetical protein